MLLLLAIFLPLTIAAVIVYWSIKNGIGPLPSTRKQINAILSCLPELVDGSILELGSGWGTLALTIARKYRKNEIFAYENSPLPYLFSTICFRLRNLHFQRRNFLNVSLSEAGAIVCYLYPGGMEKLKSKFDAELKPNTTIITNTFAVPGWKAETILDLDDLHRTKIYVYRGIRTNHRDTETQS